MSNAADSYGISDAGLPEPDVDVSKLLRNSRIDESDQLTGDLRHGLQILLGQVRRATGIGQWLGY
jgi:hypothetical protein